MCSMNTRKSIFFSQTSVRIQLHDTKGVKSQSENRKLDEETLVSRKVYLFSHRLQPVFNSTSNLDTERVSSYYGCRYQAVNLVDLLSRSSNNIDSTPSCRNSLNHLDTTRVSSYYGCRYQAVNLVDLLIHSSNIIDSTHSCRNSSNHLDTTRISSCYGCRYQAVNLVDLLSRSSNNIDSTLSCRKFANNLGTIHISSY